MENLSAGDRRGLNCWVALALRPNFTFQVELRILLHDTRLGSWNAFHPSCIKEWARGDNNSELRPNLTWLT